MKECLELGVPTRTKKSTQGTNKRKKRENIDRNKNKRRHVSERETWENTSYGARHTHKDIERAEAKKETSLFRRI